MSQPLIVETAKDAAGIASVTLKGFLAGYDVYCVKKAVSEAVNAGCPGILLNLNEVDYIDSQGVGALSSIVEEVKRSGIKIAAVRSRNQRVVRVLEQTAMDQNMQFYTGGNEALAALRFFLGMTEISKPEPQAEADEGLVAKLRSLSIQVAALEQRIQELESRVG